MQVLLSRYARCIAEKNPYTATLSSLGGISACDIPALLATGPNSIERTIKVLSGGVDNSQKKSGPPPWRHLLDYVPGTYRPTRLSSDPLSLASASCIGGSPDDWMWEKTGKELEPEWDSDEFRGRRRHMYLRELRQRFQRLESSIKENKPEAWMSTVHPTRYHRAMRAQRAEFDRSIAERESKLDMNELLDSTSSRAGTMVASHSEDVHHTMDYNQQNHGPISYEERYKALSRELWQLSQQLAIALRSTDPVMDLFPPSKGAPTISTENSAPSQSRKASGDNPSSNETQLPNPRAHEVSELAATAIKKWMEKSTMTRRTRNNQATVHEPEVTTELEHPQAVKSPGAISGLRSLAKPPSRSEIEQISQALNHVVQAIRRQYPGRCRDASQEQNSSVGGSASESEAIAHNLISAPSGEIVSEGHGEANEAGSHLPVSPIKASPSISEVSAEKDTAERSSKDLPSFSGQDVEVTNESIEDPQAKLYEPAPKLGDRRERSETLRDTVRSARKRVKAALGSSERDDIARSLRRSARRTGTEVELAAIPIPPPRTRISSKGKSKDLENRKGGIREESRLEAIEPASTEQTEHVSLEMDEDEEEPFGIQTNIPSHEMVSGQESHATMAEASATGNVAISSTSETAMSEFTKEIEIDNEGRILSEIWEELRVEPVVAHVQAIPQAEHVRMSSEATVEGQGSHIGMDVDTKEDISAAVVVASTSPSAQQSGVQTDENALPATSPPAEGPTDTADAEAVLMIEQVEDNTVADEQVIVQANDAAESFADKDASETLETGKQVTMPLDENATKSQAQVISIPIHAPGDEEPLSLAVTVDKDATIQISMDGSLEPPHAKVGSHSAISVTASVPSSGHSVSADTSLHEPGGVERKPLAPMVSPKRPKDLGLFRARNLPTESRRSSFVQRFSQYQSFSQSHLSSASQTKYDDESDEDGGTPTVIWDSSSPYPSSATLKIRSPTFPVAQQSARAQPVQQQLQPIVQNVQVNVHVHMTPKPRSGFGAEASEVRGSVPIPKTPLAVLTQSLARATRLTQTRRQTGSQSSTDAFTGRHTLPSLPLPQIGLNVAGPSRNAGATGGAPSTPATRHTEQVNASQWSAVSSLSSPNASRSSPEHRVRFSFDEEVAYESGSELLDELMSQETGFANRHTATSLASASAHRRSLTPDASVQFVAEQGPGGEGNVELDDSWFGEEF